MRSTTHPGIRVVTTIVSAVVVCVAGYWEFEQVDSGSLGSYVAIDKTSDGTIWLAYVNADSAIRFARKDSVWEYEDLDTALVRPDFRSLSPLSFDIGPGDVIGVVGLGRLAEHRDTSWASEQLPMPMTEMALSYDLACRPALVFKDSVRNVCLALRSDSSWDTSVVYVPPGPSPFILFTRASWRRHGNCAFMVAASWGELIQQYSIALGRRDSEVLSWHGLAGGLDGGGYVFAALPDTSDSIHTFWSAGDNYFTNKLVCDGVVLDSFAGIGAACLDDSGRVQCVWGRGGKLKFVLVPEPILEVGAVSDLSWCDITTDVLSQPVIAYCLDDGSIYVAHGIDVAGLSDEPQGAAPRFRPSSVSIVRGVLVLPRDMTELPGNSDRVPRPSLLDISGRKVMDLRSGANDISGIAPGVYFVRDAGCGAGDESRTFKVVIQR
ncbi:T9SS type A sorting domain-containing protein [candidate division WOR-3 bacterium]|nr:T9SS type A sorting domain-containing protein [candidate division WOR-3 bacterium]